MGIIIIARLIIFKNNWIAHSRQATLAEKKWKVNAKLEDKISPERDV